jgi:SfnB family sulfur acquisition oxidoreductase
MVDHLAVSTGQDNQRPALGETYPAQPRPSTPAHVIKDDNEAIRIARELAAVFAREAAERDRQQRLPIAELDLFSQSGLWGINVPKAYGGAGVSYETVVEVIKIIAAADPSLGQLPQNHLCVVDAINADGSEEQKKFFFAEVLSGLRFGNAFSEPGKNVVTDFKTSLTPHAGGYLVKGQKFYSTGALLAHLVPIAAVDQTGKPHLAIAERDAPGLTVINDWSSFGQRTTASGTVILEDVFVPASHVVPAYKAFERPTAAGPISQIIQAAIDAGIARGAIDDTISFVRTQSRPWVDSGQQNAAEDQFSIYQIGELETRLHAAEAVLVRAAKAVDLAAAEPDEDTVAKASIAVARAKVLTTEIAILAGNKLFELAGTRSTLARHNLDRHWRNARAHTLHDPVRWKYFHLGNYALNGVKPPRHPWS